MFELITTHVRASVATVIVALGSLLIFWINRIIKYRQGHLRLHGPVNALPLSLWFGTIPAYAAVLQTSPMDTHPMITLTLLHKKHELDALYYLDNWPMSRTRQLMINDPALAAQLVQKQDIPKAPEVGNFIRHVTGPTSMISTDGAQWKEARSLFNPGFALNHLMTLVPMIVNDTAVFVELLDALATSGEIVQLEEMLAKLTIDIMGHVVLDYDLKSQTESNELVEAFRGSVEWTSSPIASNPLLDMNPVRALAKRWYARRMINYLQDRIQERLVMRSRDEKSTLNTDSRRRPAIDLAVDEYAKTSTGEVDVAFLNMAIDQMRSFIFAGHDTSSSTACYVYYLLEKHPEAMEKTRAELDAVFGKGKAAGEAIKSNPSIVNELAYTTAVIKETLRLFPPASTVRRGTKDTTLTYKGHTFETEDMMIWVNTHTIHRRADLFPSPESFIPERFLAAPSTWPEQGSIPKDAFRPFEKGLRNCIGQELAMLEMKIIVAMTVREFDVKAEYEFWDRKMGREKPGEMLDGKRGTFGYRAYQQMKVTAKPADGMPASVRRNV